VGQTLLTRAGVRASRLLLLCAIVFVIVGLGSSAIDLAMNRPAVSELNRAWSQLGLEFARQKGLSAQEAAETARIFREASLYVLPGFVTALSAMCGLMCFLLSQFALRRSGLRNAPIPRFREWQLAWYLAWGFLIGLAATVSYGFFQGDQGRIALYVGLNLLVIFGSVYMIQGLAVAYWYLERLKLAGPVRAMLIALALLAQALFLVLTWIGVFDTWFNYRKLKREI